MRVRPAPPAIGTVTALVAIHQAGIVHRDFKPSNVLLAPDGPRVIDFGIAKALDRTSTLTATAIGTPSYMTPEQLAGENAGSSADMFAWGCTMVFAATGQPPFGTDSLPAIFNRISDLEPDLRAITDPALRELVGQCLAKDAALRPAAGEALLRLLGHASGAPSPDRASWHPGRGLGRRRAAGGFRHSSPSRQAGPGHPQQGPSYRQAVSQLHGGPPAHPFPLPSPYPAEGAAKRGRGVQLAIGRGSRSHSSRPLGSHWRHAAPSPTGSCRRGDQHPAGRHLPAGWPHLHAHAHGLRPAPGNQDDQAPRQLDHAPRE